jgi:DNA invertase Pin-like site-specific DNA recombinase
MAMSARAAYHASEFMKRARFDGGMKERVVTIRDIAKRAGVSVATVSRTLREPEAVRPAKRMR